MNKKFIVRLSDEERGVCQEVIKKLKGSSERVRRAQILLKADADGPAWPDSRIADAFNCRVQTIENLRKRLVTEGFERALESLRSPLEMRGFFPLGAPLYRGSSLRPTSETTTAVDPRM